MAYLKDFLALVLCQEQKGEEHFLPYFLRTSQCSSFDALTTDTPKSADVAQLGRDEAGCFQGNHLETVLDQG